MPNIANHVSLFEAQLNYILCGAAEKKNAGRGRPACDAENCEQGWRLLDAGIDNIEEPMRGIDYADSYPIYDLTVLYYWRESYWRQFND